MTWLPLFLLYAVSLMIALAQAGIRSGRNAVAGETSDQDTPSDPILRLLIIGATGGTGRQLVTQALAKGYEVTALVRDPAKWDQQDPQLTITVGDVLAPETLAAAMQGQDAVLCALGHKRLFMPTRILSAGTQNIVSAMEAHGVRRLVCETALGLGDSSGLLGLYYTFLVIPLILPFYFWDKVRQEQVVAASALAWVIVRPGALTNGAQEGGYRVGRGVGNFVSTVSISRADVADFMLNQLESDEHLGEAVSICGQ